MDLNKAIVALNGISPLVAKIPVVGPSLVIMLSVAQQVCEAADGAAFNAYKQLAQQVSGYASAVSKAIQADSRFSAGSNNAFVRERNDLIEEIVELTAVFEEVLRFAEERGKPDKKRQKRPFGFITQRIREVWHKNNDLESVKRLSQKVESSMKSFKLGNEVRELDAMGRIQHQLKAITAPRPDSLKQELTPVLSARFDWHDMPEGCLADTRIDLLSRIRAWILDDAPSSPSLFALTGLAGTGKTTVAQSICIEFDPKWKMVSFFVSRSCAERRDPRNIVRTIAYQLAAQHAGVQAAVVSALRNGRGVVTRPLAEQVESLIVDPLRALTDSKSRILIVIDALDECIKVGGCESGELIPLLSSGIRQLSGQVKLLITSREEPKMMAMFRELGLNAPSSLVRLQNIENVVVQKDVKAYFTHHFRLISKHRGFSDQGAWPSEANVDLLVEMTGKLFVFAALVVRILSSASINPKKRLEEILRSSPTTTPGSGFQLLDELYLNILSKAASTTEDSVDEVVHGRVCNIVRTLALSQSPLSANALSELLEEEASIVWEDIEHLSSVLVVPDSPHEPITFFHPSFRNYVLTHCTGGRFQVDSGS